MAKVTKSQLDCLARELTMRRVGAVRLDGNTGPWYGTCERCGKRTFLQWCHFNSRRFLSLRWDGDNACALCSGCHFAWSHHRPGEFTEWMKQRLGMKRYNRLRLILKTSRRPDYEAIRLALAKELSSRTARGSDG